MKVLSWNILSPECLVYFWKTYGLIPLNASDSASDYVEFNVSRYNNIAKQLATYDADVLCLQESLVNPLSYLDGKTIHQWLADKLNYTVVGIASKKSLWKLKNEFNVGEPYDQCVAVLVKNELKDVAVVADSSERFTNSAHFPSGIGTPYLTVKVNDVYVTTLHIKMNYPQISSLEETVQRLKSKFDDAVMRKMVFVGDFNAKTKEGDTLLHEINEKYLKGSMSFITGGSTTDDHLLLGHDLTGDLKRDVRNMLIINAKRDEDTAHNQRLVDNGECTTDHELFLLELTS